MSGSPSSEPETGKGAPADAGRAGPDGSAVGGGIREERAAGGVVVREFDDGPRILLIRDPYGRWSLPKGHLEGGETPEEAAVREVREETKLGQVELGSELDTLSWTFRDGTATVRKICTYYLMRSDRGRIRPEVSAGIDACAWVPVDRAAERIDYENTSRLVRKVGEMLG